MYEVRAERGSWGFRCERPITGARTGLPLARIDAANRHQAVGSALVFDRQATFR